jgi:predicted O-linked N-acetylglucosamine transferase (SPINDLY family)
LTPLEANSSRSDTLAEADRAHLAKSYAEAIELYRLALGENPSLFDAWYGLASASASRLEFGDAIAAYRRTLELRSHDAGLRVNLAEALFSLGHVSDAVRNYRIAAAADDAEVREMAVGNLACIAPGDPALDDAMILDMRRCWAAQEAKRVRPCRRPRMAQNERLRIAYYGAFFAERNWMKMYMGVLNAHDRDRFEVNLIVDGALPTAASGYVDRDNDRIWHVNGVPNAELAEHIAAANIDVLIDLNGYSHKSRMPLLLYRAAPVQIAWNGMYGSTGFPDVDVLIADDTALPCGEERHYSERIYRVRHTYLPFQMFYETPDVTAPPSLQTGHITFGSLNSAYKLTPETLQAWSRILHTIPTARLLLRNAALDHVSNRADLLARFAGLNIAAERLSLLGRADHMSFLRTYDQIDVALDAFPYNGGTTTVEALWQGVPVLTIDGDRWAARTSRSILTAAGLADWVAADLPSFVAKAAKLANAELAPMRAAQRGRIAASPACDVASLCRELEELYLRETEQKRILDSAY